MTVPFVPFYHYSGYHASLLYSDTRNNNRQRTLDAEPFIGHIYGDIPLVCRGFVQRYQCAVSFQRPVQAADIYHRIYLDLYFQYGI